MNKNKQTQVPTHKPPLCPSCGFSVSDPEMICTEFNSIESFVMILCPHCKVFLNSCFRPTHLMQGVDPIEAHQAAQGKTKSGLFAPESAIAANQKRDAEKDKPK